MLHVGAAAAAAKSPKTNSGRPSALSGKRSIDVKVELEDKNDPPEIEETFRVGQRIDVLDAVQVWYCASVSHVKTAKTGSVSQVRVSFDGWDSSNDETLKVPSERIAPIFTYTREFKGLAYLELEEFEGLWPCIVQFRMPTSSKRAEKELTEVEPRVFVIPYVRDLLDLEGDGCWVEPKDIHVWAEELVKAEDIDDENLRKAYEAARTDTAVKPLEKEGDDLFGQGALLRKEYRVECDIVKKKQSVKRIKREFTDDIDHKTAKNPPLFQIHNICVESAVKATKECLTSSGYKKYANRAFQIAHFFLYCYERDMMRVRSNEGQDWPMSESEVLGYSSFCNNYRELDRGTAYFHDQVLQLWDASTQGGKSISRQEWVEKVLWAAVCYRLMNRVDTFLSFEGGIPQMEDFDRFLKYAAKRRVQGPIFTGAHQTCNWDNFCKSMNELAKNEGKKLKKYASCICEASLEEDGLEKCVDILSEIQCVGPFFAWQISCDLMESQCLGLCNENDWVLLGPGAQNGIGRIFGEGQDCLSKVEVLREIQDKVYEALNLKYPKWDNRNLSLKSLEHALCEFCKYYNVEGSGGRPGNAKLATKCQSRYKELDDEKTCSCGENGLGEVQVTLCDTCLNAYCGPCEMKQGNHPSNASVIAGWRCSRCKKFDGVQFED